MVTLVSPGVDVEIIDESFYGSGTGPGTIPLILIATASNKSSPTTGVGVAPATVPSEAGKLFLATSQRELIQNFGAPTFKTVGGTIIQGDETSEYGLHAAYSYLGISSRCYVLRADIDLAALAPSVTPPVGAPSAGTYWLDLSNTSWGLFQSNGNSVPGSAWVSQPVAIAMGSNVDVSLVPVASFGSDGDYAVVPLTNSNLFYEKINSVWYQIGTTLWAALHPTNAYGTISPTLPQANPDTMNINGVVIAFTHSDLLADIVGKINLAMSSQVPPVPVIASVVNHAILISNTSGSPLSIQPGSLGSTILTTLGLAPTNVNGVTNIVYNNSAAYPSPDVQGSLWFKGNPANRGANVVVRYYNATTAQWILLTTPFYPFNSALADGSLGKDQAAGLALSATVIGSVYVGYDAKANVIQLRRWTGTYWNTLVYEADLLAPTMPPADGTLFYNVDFAADIMVGDGENWRGYRTVYPATDLNGVIISGSIPAYQSTGSVVVDNDLWIDSSDTENYPMMYRYSASLQRWQAIDKADSTTPFGIVFEDARQDSGGSILTSEVLPPFNLGSTVAADLALSDYLDPDAPDPRLYPAGMLLFNTRASTNNVKVWRPNYFLAGGYDANTDFTANGYNIGNPAELSFGPVASAGRWVNASGNSPTGEPYMGRKAQRAMVVRALAAQAEANQDIRSELVYYNLLAAPGYPELIPDLVTLNTDQMEYSFIVADTPIRLPSDATSLQSWATNAANVASDGENGLVTANPYVGIHYPWGLGEDLDGNEVMIPPSSVALRVMAYNDQVSYQWFAPAGFTRGLVTNASSVGYLSTAGVFVPVILNLGQRNTLYTNNINPIAFIVNRGLVVYGQKTLSPVASALDRINVARLTCYLKYQLDIIVKPYLFEQNDTQTRLAATNTVSAFFNGLVGLRALNDYAVLCDTTNNTPDRIDANELWIDVAIQPLKAVEFIYIPVRLLATGASLTLNGSAPS